MVKTAKQPLADTKKQIGWYLSLLETYFNNSSDKKKLMESKNLQEVNDFMKNYQFPPFEPAIQEMTFEEKRNVMKNVFLIILKFYEKLEERHRIDLSHFKNHARVLEQFEDMPRYLMKKIADDFHSIEKQFSIKLPEIPFEIWTDG